jgi:transposase
MSDLIWLSAAQMRRIEPHFRLSHGVPRVDDRRVISGIIFVIRNGLRWRNAPADYGPHKTIYNRFIRWSRLGVFNRIFAALAAKGGKPDRLMIDATHLKAHGHIVSTAITWLLVPSHLKRRAKYKKWIASKLRFLVQEAWRTGSEAVPAE